MLDRPCFFIKSSNSETHLVGQNALSTKGLPYTHRGFSPQLKHPRLSLWVLPRLTSSTACEACIRLMQRHSQKHPTLSLRSYSVCATCYRQRHQAPPLLAPLPVSPDTAVILCSLYPSKQALLVSAEDSSCQQHSQPYHVGHEVCNQSKVARVYSNPICSKHCSHLPH